ncbi:MAG: hypothetical protein JXB04_02220, partial [Kiritimatiellae bacterium]|nr:hypothetical protein [Kiritimatiellia bacterium]
MKLRCGHLPSRPVLLLILCALVAASPAFAQAPPPPDYVSATDGTYANRVDLNWSYASNANGYTLYRNVTNDSGSASLIQDWIGVESASDTSVVPGTIYWYWVKAYSLITTTRFFSGYSPADSGYAQPAPTVYYVNDEYTSGDVYCTAPGSDTNNGLAQSTPMASLQALLDTYNVGPGDTIMFDTGLYGVSNSILIGAADAGSAGNPVVIRCSTNLAAGGTRVQYVTSSGAPSPYTITNASWEYGDDELSVPGGAPGTNGWMAWGPLDGARGAWDTAFAQSGSNSLRQELDAGAPSTGSVRYILVGQHVDIRNTNALAGTVTFSGWFRGDLSQDPYSNCGTAFLKMEFMDTNLSVMGAVHNEFDVDHNGRPGYGVNTGGNWTNFVITATNMPAATRIIHFAVGLNNNGAELPYTGWWDNVSATVYLATPASTAAPVVRVEDAEGITVEHLQTIGGWEGIRLRGVNKVLLTDCASWSNACGMWVAGTVEIRNSRAYNNGTGLHVATGQVSVASCSFWDNAADQVCLTAWKLGMTNCILSAQGTGSVGISVAIYADYAGDYNDIHTVPPAKVGGIGGTNVDTLAAWQALRGQDAHSLNTDPLFADPNAGDAHLKSMTARYDTSMGAFVVDASHSPCIDVGAPVSAYTNESAPNGNRINIGAYGNTREASKSLTNGWLQALTFNDGGIASGTCTLYWAAGGSATDGTVQVGYSGNAGSTWSVLESNVAAWAGAYVWDSTTVPDTTQA